MTTATKSTGRTFVIKARTITVEGMNRQVRSFPLRDDVDFVNVEHQVDVPNGMWVLEGHMLGAVVGAERHEITNLAIDVIPIGGESLYVCRKPFGVVEVELPEGEILFSAADGLSLRVAHQVHKGELGKSVTIPQLKGVRQASDSTDKQDRRGRQWVLLEDFSRAAGADAAELVRIFWLFSGIPKYSGPTRDGTFVHVVVAKNASEIKGKSPQVTFCQRKAEFTKVVRKNPGKVWIPRRFAITILQLKALGVEDPAKLFTA